VEFFRRPVFFQQGFVVALFFFVSDLHGKISRYEKLLDRIAYEKPDAVFLGGDLLPHPMDVAWLKDKNTHGDDTFIASYLVPAFKSLQNNMKDTYPQVFAILGNDDAWVNEEDMLEAEADNIWTYVHGKKAESDPFTVYGYSCVPPTPFQLKDWERYDVSRFVDPGCLGPEEGVRSDGMTERELKNTTIKLEITHLVGEDNLDRAIVLFHSPPYKTKLDRAALDGKMIDHAPLDVHVGSIAIQQFIRDRQPAITLHGHIHESRRLTGSWLEHCGRTVMMSAAHDGPELALVRFNPGDPGSASLELL
jgi:uncharacterized protein